MLLTALLQKLSEETEVHMGVSFAGHKYELDAEILQGIECVDISLDSRDAKEKGIFLAMEGDQTDGRNYINEVFRKSVAVIFYESKSLTSDQQKTIDQSNCVCIAIHHLNQYAGQIASLFFDQPSEQIQVYGITGTNGKTSCAYMLAQSFNFLGYQTAFMGTIGVGLPDKLTVSTHTTLNAVALQRYLAKLVRQGFTHVCIEVSSHALDQSRVAGVNFYAVLYTNLSQDHLDYHKTMQTYAEAKKKLFTDFNPTLAVINGDDPFGLALLEETNAEFIVSYGKQGGVTDTVFEDISASRSGVSFVLEARSLELDIESQLIGLLNVPNLALVATTLLALGVDREKIEQAIHDCQAPPGRMELFSQKDLPMVVVDYAHTPDAIQAALESCRVHCQGELWIVFGCGGDRDQSKRALMGSAAEQYADKVVVCSDNPRSENPDDIIAAIIAPMTIEPIVIEHRATAVAYAVEQAAVNDLILLAGKGHEAGQIIGDETVAYSDRDWAKHCLGIAA